MRTLATRRQPSCAPPTLYVGLEDVGRVAVEGDGVDVRLVLPLDAHHLRHTTSAVQCGGTAPYTTAHSTHCFTVSQPASRPAAPKRVRRIERSWPCRAGGRGCVVRARRVPERARRVYRSAIACARAATRGSRGRAAHLGHDVIQGHVQPERLGCKGPGGGGGGTDGAAGRPVSQWGCGEQGVG